VPLVVWGGVQDFLGKLYGTTELVLILKISKIFCLILCVGFRNMSLTATLLLHSVVQIET
jgi:hypothetical protein